MAAQLQKQYPSPENPDQLISQTPLGWTLIGYRKISSGFPKKKKTPSNRKVHDHRSPPNVSYTAPSKPNKKDTSPTKHFGVGGDGCAHVRRDDGTQALNCFTVDNQFGFVLSGQDDILGSNIGPAVHRDWENIFRRL